MGGWLRSQTKMGGTELGGGLFLGLYRRQVVIVGCKSAW